MRIAALLSSLAIVLTGGACRNAPPEPTRERPNFLVIVADDLGYSDLGIYGGEIPTPNLDALAERGTIGANFYVAPRGAPTRAMLLTGVDNHIAGFGTSRSRLAPNQEGKPGYEGTLSPRVVTVASLLQKSGYRTLMAGTWGLGSAPSSLPSARGFENAFVLHDGAASYFSDMRSAIPGRDRALFTHDGKEVRELPDDYYSTRFFTDFVIDGIEERHADGRPFFAYLAYQAPHGPFGLPDEWRDRAKGRYDDGFDKIRDRRLLRLKVNELVREEVQPYPGLPTIPRWGDLPEDQQKHQSRKMELYAALVENLDFHVGRLVAYLEEKDELRNTVIVFLSDNGAEPANRGPNGMEERDLEWYAEQFPLTEIEDWGKPGSFVEYGPAWAQVSMVPFRLFKGTQAEGGIRSPIIMSGMGVPRAKKAEKELLHVMDVPATILDLADVAHPATFAGRSVVPLEGTSWFSLRRSLLVKDVPHVWLGMEFAGDRVLRKGRWKLVWMEPPFGAGSWRLYRIDRDPSELQDLAGRKPKTKAELEALWQEYAKAHGVVIPKEETPEDETAEEPVAAR